MLETYRECLQDVFDMPALRAILQGIRTRTLDVVEVETPSASPMAGGVAARQAVRERLRQEAAGTYLPETLAENDSVLRRLPARAGRTL